MLGKTHMAVGIAATLACTCPKTVAELSMAVAIGTVGALIPDIDVESSESCRKANGAILLLSAISAAVAALDYFMGIKILEDVAGNSDAARIFAGVLLFVGTCVFGKKQPHRSFMHSFLALALLDGSLALAFPLFLPYFTVGFLSHLVLDLCNQKGLKLFYPCKYGVCLGWFRAHGWADRLLCTAGCAAALLLSVKAFWEMFLGKL